MSVINSRPYIGKKNMHVARLRLGIVHFEPTFLALKTIKKAYKITLLYAVLFI
jgi:hypothetical protein